MNVRFWISRFLFGFESKKRYNYTANFNNSNVLTEKYER